MSSSPYVTPEDYLAFERGAADRHEYLHGEIVAMAGGSLQHSAIAANLSRLVGNAIQDRPFTVFNSDARVCVAWGKLITYPDVSVLCGKPEFVDDQRDTYTNPTFIAEVLSPSTRTYDRGEKARLYRLLPSLAEYLIVEQTPVDIEHYRRLPNGHWDIALITDLDAVLRLESLDCEISVRDIYRNVALL